MATTKISVKWNHEWVAIDLGNNRGLSSSYGGTKARGSIPDFLFDAWSELGKMIKVAKVPAHVRVLLDEVLVAGPTYKDKVEAFVQRIPAMWPEWDVPPKSYTVGQVVKFQFRKRDPIIEGTVESIRKTMITCRFPDRGAGLIGIPADLLDAYNAA